MTYRIIGNMTGNSMDAIDLVLTEFNGHHMRDICSYSEPYSKEMQQKMEYLRKASLNKTAAEILTIPDFQIIHDEYIRQIANCINKMCYQNHIDKNTINAIGFHGKTLDHNPPSQAKHTHTSPYTLQIGSGKMLSDLTGIKVVYDFRSAPVMAGFDGAPLIAAHNAHISLIEGDGCYYNGGNTSNFTWVIDKEARLTSDAGPCNEYIDNFIRKNTSDSFDTNGKYGSQGSLHPDILQTLFDIGRDFYERALPKSGDPQYYHTTEILHLIDSHHIPLCDKIHTLEYFAAYIAMHALTLTNINTSLPPAIILFGGGWKNPIVLDAFQKLLSGTGFVLPEHKKQFDIFLNRFSQKPIVKYSAFGEMMEPRLMADLARYRLDNRAWDIPEITQSGQKIICGIIAQPDSSRTTYDDMINRAAKGWQ